MTRASEEPEYDNSDHYRLMDQLEIQAAMNSDHVFTITGAVRDMLLAKEVSADKISVLPNAVDITYFKPCEMTILLTAPCASALSPKPWVMPSIWLQKPRPG